MYPSELESKVIIQAILRAPTSDLLSGNYLSSISTEFDKLSHT